MLPFTLLNEPTVLNKERTEQSSKVLYWTG
jgi:hypothetical protein